MSSLPGLTLADYLAWEYNFTTEISPNANVNLNFAEALGTVARRPEMSSERFQVLLDALEPYRESIEDKLSYFNEETQSWRGYSEYVASSIPKIVHEMVCQYIQCLLKPNETKLMDFEELSTALKTMHSQNVLCTEEVSNIVSAYGRIKTQLMKENNHGPLEKSV